jgi:tetratricopeptide (TPR) repeat protein
MTEEETLARDKAESEPGPTTEDIEAFLKRDLEQCREGCERKLYALMQFYERTGRPAAAVPYLQERLASTGDPDAQAYYLLTIGQLMERAGDLEGAMGHYVRGCVLDRGTGAVRYLLENNLGFCLNQFGHFAEAEPHCRAAVALDPERHNAHKNLGVSLAGQGQYAEAAQSFVQAVRQNRYDPRALHHLQQLLAGHLPEVTRDLPEVAEWLEECRALVGPGNQMH